MVLDMHENIKFEELSRKLKEIDVTGADLHKLSRMMQNLEKFDDDMEKAQELLNKQTEILYFIITIFGPDVYKEKTIEILNTALTEYTSLF